ncbi:hypothetical protein AX14_004232 [Amanita brunnescens Koide BX004]|nr:hypothetical protein AX14_004232 [Amanita brunnescens Koide BX004]
MQWLSRGNSPSKTRVAEPKLVSSRTGILGEGAIVVRTPEEALRDTRVRLSPSSAEASNARPVRTKKPSKKHDIYFSSLQSPPLPPLPVPGEEETQFLSGSEDHPPPPTRAAPLPPSEYPEECSAVGTLAQPITGQIISRPCSEEELAIPPILFGVRSTSPPPPFRPILLSEPPTGNVDVHNTIVALETSTETYKTSLSTLLSQPSLLSDYVRSLLPRSRSRSDASSVYSTDSDNSGQDRSYSPPCRINIFLDRPSAPYATILSYLRSSSSSNPNRATLPMTVQLVHNYTQERLEALLELRDEAAFLKLVELHGLCEDELRSRQGTVLFNKHYSNDSNTLGSVHSQQASAYSLHTPAERVESDTQPNLRLSRTSTTNERHRRTKSKDSKHDSERQSTRQLPIPEPRAGSRTGSTSPPRPYPAGWI